MLTPAMRILVWLTCGCVLFLSAPKVIADELTTYGPCSPIFHKVEGDVRTTCINNFGPAITYNFSEESVQFLESYYQLDAESIRSLLSTVQGKNIPPYEIIPYLTKTIDELKKLRDEASSYYGDDAKAKAIAREIDLAVHRMDIDSAKKLYGELIVAYASIAASKGSVKDILNLVMANRNSGKLNLAMEDYDEAYVNFKEALNDIPGRHKDLIAEMQLDLAHAALLGTRHDDREVLVQDAVSAAKKIGGDSSIYLKSLQLQIMILNEKEEYQKSIELFRKDLLPKLSVKNGGAVMDINQTLLCLSCTAHAAIKLNDYALALEISDIALRSYNDAGRPNASELVPVLNNRATALSALERNEEALEEKRHALKIAEHNSPDGFYTGFPYLYINLANSMEDRGERKELLKTTIVSLVKNFPLEHDNTMSLLHDAVGLDVTILCTTLNPKAVHFLEPPFFEFDPNKCHKYDYMGSIVLWNLKDADDLTRRISSIASPYVKDHQTTSASVILTLGTELIMAGFQRTGVAMCNREISATISKRLVSPETAEAAYKMAQFSFLHGYEFVESDDKLFKFAVDGFEQSLGFKHRYTQDAALSYVTFLWKTNNKEAAKEYATIYLKKFRDTIDGGEQEDESFAAAFEELLRSPTGWARPKAKVLAFLSAEEESEQ